MYQHQPNRHSLMADAGKSIRVVAGHYPAFVEGEVPGRYYRLVSLSIIPLPAVDRWQTLSQWEPEPGLYGHLPDGLGTSP